MEAIYDLHEKKEYQDSNALIDELVANHTVDQRTWLMVHTLKSFNLKELKEWEASKKTLVEVVKRLNADQGVDTADAKLYEDFESKNDFGEEAIRKALFSEDSQESAD